MNAIQRRRKRRKRYEELIRPWLVQHQRAFEILEYAMLAWRPTEMGKLVNQVAVCVDIENLTATVEVDE